jgi:hypothetical protein
MSTTDELRQHEINKQIDSILSNYIVTLKSINDNLPPSKDKFIAIKSVTNRIMEYYKHLPY